MSFHAPEKYRQHQAGALSSTQADGNNGVFYIPGSLSAKRPMALRIIASDGEGWEHVSVSTAGRTPTWDEMCHVKSLFWDDEDCVLQFHPPRSRYVNCHPYCLHLWRPTWLAIVMPPPIMVGPGTCS